MNSFEHINKMNFDALVLEGGSLKCAFTAGILDVLMDSDFPEFKYYYGYPVDQWPCRICCQSNDLISLRSQEHSLKTPISLATETPFHNRG